MYALATPTSNTLLRPCYFQLGLCMCVMPHADGVRGTGVRCCSFSGSPKKVQNGNVKSEPKYRACEESPIHAFYFWTLSCSSVASVASSASSADFFVFFSQSCQPSGVTSLNPWISAGITMWPLFLLPHYFNKTALQFYWSLHFSRASPRIWTCDTRPLLLVWIWWGLGKSLFYELSKLFYLQLIP